MSTKNIVYILLSVVVVAMISIAGCHRHDNDYYDRDDFFTYFDRISVYSAQGDQQKPELAYSETNRNFMVVFETDQYGDSDIGGTEITSGVSWIAVEVEPGAQLNPDIAYNSRSNQYLVVWEDKRAGVAADIYGRLIDGDVSAPVGNSFVISSDPSDEEMPAIAYSSESDVYCITWHDDAAGKREIKAMILDDTGTALTGVIAVSQDTEDQENPRIAFSPQRDEFLIVWTDYRNSSRPDIYGRLIDPSGSFGSSEREIMRSSNSIENPDVAWNPDRGNYIVVANRYGAYSWNIVGQLISAGANIIGSIKDLAPSQSDQRNPRVAFNPRHGDYTVVWEDYDPFRADSRIARRIIGSNLYAAGSVGILSNSDFNSFPAVGITPDDTIITVWTTYRTTGDITGVRER